jgi:hypothetical protein
VTLKKRKQWGSLDYYRSWSAALQQGDAWPWHSCYLLVVVPLPSQDSCCVVSRYIYTRCVLLPTPPILSRPTAAANADPSDWYAELEVSSPPCRTLRSNPIERLAVPTEAHGPRPPPMECVHQSVSVLRRFVFSVGRGLEGRFVCVFLFGWRAGAAPYLGWALAALGFSGLIFARWSC